MCFKLNVIICNSGFCNQVLLSGYTIIRSLTMPFKPFVIYRQLLLNSDAVTKCCIKKIHRKAIEAVTTVPHQDDGHVRILAHTNLKQGTLQPLRPPNQASRDFYWQAGSMSVSFEAIMEDGLLSLCLPKECGNKISEGEIKREERGQCTI